MAHIHIEDSSTSWDAPITIVIVRCGRVALVYDDGTIQPAGFDFVPAYGVGTCPECKNADPPTIPISKKATV